MLVGTKGRYSGFQRRYFFVTVQIKPNASLISHVDIGILRCIKYAFGINFMLRAISNIHKQAEFELIRCWACSDEIEILVFKPNHIGLWIIPAKLHVKIYIALS